MPDDGMFSGWAGVAVALRAWSDATGDPAAAEAAAQMTRQIAGRVTQAPPDPGRYTDVISGDAGLLLVLIGDDSDVSVQAAQIVGRPAGGRRGTVPGGVALADGSGWERIMPGFSTAPPGRPTPWPRPGGPCAAATWWTSPSAAPRRSSPPGISLEAGRCRC